MSYWEEKSEREREGKGVQFMMRESNEEREIERERWTGLPERRERKTKLVHSSR